MVETHGDIWDYRGRAVIAITTNGFVSGKGEAILGRGCASQAGERFPGLSWRLGELLRTHGNHVHPLVPGIVSFPVEDSPWALPDLQLIRRSAMELRMLADREGWSLDVVPRPGCGGGGLSWSEVRPLLADVLDDRFVVITEEGG